MESILRVRIRNENITLSATMDALTVLSMVLLPFLLLPHSIAALHQSA